MGTIYSAMDERQNFPDINRLSVLVSTILFAYAVTPFVAFEKQLITLKFGGSVFTFSLSFTEIISLLVAVLAAVGTDWLLRGHPYLGSQKTWQHIILPGLTAWVIGVPLGSLGEGLEWWAVFAFGAILMILVIIAEYIVVDLSDERHPPAVIGLTAVSFALYLVVAIVIRSAQGRLFLQLPALVATIALVCLRSLYLKLGGRWCFGWSIGIALFIGQIAAGLHYLPLKPLTFGLVLLGPAYALTSLAATIEEGRSLRSGLFEPLAMLTAIWALAAIL